MSPVNADDRDVHVYTHPKNSLDEHAEESEKEVMFHIDRTFSRLKSCSLCTTSLPFFMHHVQHIAKTSQRVFLFVLVYLH